MFLTMCVHKRVGTHSEADLTFSGVCVYVCISGNMIPSVSSHCDHQSIPVCEQLTHSLRHGTYFSKNRKISEKLKLLVSLQKCHSCKVDSRARAQVCCVCLLEASKDLLIGLWVPTWHSTGSHQLFARLQRDQELGSLYLIIHRTDKRA